MSTEDNASWNSRTPPPPPPRIRPSVRHRPSPKALGVLLIVLAILAVPIWVWFGWRIEPDSGEIAILIRKTGKDLPAGEVLAPSADYKGIQAEVLPEGRYFRNPYTWTWECRPMTDIPAGKLGVLVRRFGKDLPAGRIIAEKDTKGVLLDFLSPGKYRVNPYAYDVLVVNATQVKPGHVGVVTSLIGKDVLTDDVGVEDRNTFIVAPEFKGVQAEVLDAGTYYLNPFAKTVVELNLQSQRFEMSGADAITFLTVDGFNVSVEGTLEFSIQREQAALLTHKVGDMDDILKKLILPRARGFSRVEGSKKSAVDFIVGETRQEFQNSLEQHLRETCKPWGVSVNSVLIRNIIPPQEIASIIRSRELAVQDARKIDRQIEQAKSGAELARQQMLAEQNSKRIAAETAKLRAEIAAKQEMAVRLTAAQRELDVAKVGLETARLSAQAITLEAQGQRDAIRKLNQSEADVLASQVKAFGSGEAYVRYLLYGKLAPRIESILTTDRQDGTFGLPLPAAGAVKNTEVSK